MTINFTLEAAQKMVDDAITLKGEDFAYERPRYGDCEYITRRAHNPETGIHEEIDPAPGCIWGHAFVAAGVEMHLFEKLEGSDITQVLSSLNSDGIVGTTEWLARAWAYSVQAHQDAGNSWSESRAHANEALALSKNAVSPEKFVMEY